MVNNYLYAAFTPDDNFTPPTRDLAEYNEQVEHIAFGIGERWTNEWEPSLIPILDKARTTDFDALRDPELIAAFDEQLNNIVYMWGIRGWINLTLVPATALTDFYKAEIQPADRNEAWQLLQGYNTKSVEASSGLWQLSRIVKDSTMLSKVFSDMDRGRIVGTIEDSDEGRAFLVRLRAYLDQFGGAVTVFMKWRTPPGSKIRLFR
jgi:hypothetical protein